MGEGVVVRLSFGVVWQTMPLGHRCFLAIFEVSKFRVFFVLGVCSQHDPTILERPRRLTKLEQHFV